MSDAKSIEYNESVAQVRKACRQFAMLYFHFSKTLVEELGEEKAAELIQKAVFELAIDRSEQLREKAESLGLEFTIENFQKITDLPKSGWVKELGKDHCPYAETWVKYFQQNPWFQRIAPLYCDVIDTTNAEDFTRTMSHKITKNVLTGSETCEREYFESKAVSEGVLTYGKKEE